MPRIKQARELNKLPDDVDKSPASITKYASAGGLGYHINLDQPEADLEKNKV